MRPVEKGISPRHYTSYKSAKKDLANRIGWYCSYCEMPVKNMIEIEHVIPKSKGGNEVDWNNFLLACRYCNSLKDNKNTTRDEHFFPDTDNTILTFEYSEAKTIEAKNNLTHENKKIANNTINLLGLNRYPGGSNEPTEADTRWISRNETWNLAKDTLTDWLNNQTYEAVNYIARTAKASGHFSIWITVFKDFEIIIEALYNIFPATYVTKLNNNNEIIKRGKI